MTPHRITRDVDLRESFGERTIRLEQAAGCNAMLREKLCAFAELFGLRPRRLVRAPGFGEAMCALCASRGSLFQRESAWI
jgi:hypothetical protein